MQVYPTTRRLISLASLTLVLAACGSQPFDPYQSQREQLTWEQQQRAAQTAQNRAAFLEPALRVLDLALVLAPVVALLMGLDAYRLRRRLVVADAAGKLPMPRRVVEQDARPALAALGAFHTTELARATPSRTVAAPPSAPALLSSDVAPLALPGLTDLSSLVTDWRPSLQAILLGVGPGNVRYTVHARDLCHVALAGANGGGKSNIMRLVLSQLQAAGAKVVLADPHFAPRDIESGDDWRPIAQRLHLAPAVSASAIGDLLAWLATDELPQRLERRREGQSAGMPLFLALDELPAIVSDVKQAPDHMARLLREGRKANLFVVGAAQDWLAKTLGGSGAVRDCYRTAYYVGGDTTSARVLLDVQGRVDDGQLGQGLAMLRSKATPTAQLVRVPLASNEALHRLLDVTPMGVSATVAGAATLTQPAEEPRKALESARNDSNLVPEMPEYAEICRRLVAQGLGQNKVIEAVWGVKPGGSESYKAAREQYQQIVGATA